MDALRGGANPVEITSPQQFVDLISARSEAATAATPSLAGKPYCPGSGTEGLAFEDAFCCDCVYYGENTDNGCPIAFQAHMVADTADATFPNQWVYDENGQPSCRMYESRGFTADAERERALYRKAMQGE